MMIDFKSYKQNISDKKCAVIGLGISNIPLIDFLCDAGVKNITVFDKGGRTEKDKTEVENRCLKLCSDGKIKAWKIGEDYLDDLSGFDVIFRTPGMRPDNPAILKAVKNGARLTSEMEEFMSLVPCKTIAVTGSDGKTTTTTIIYKLLSKQFENTGRNIYVGGNIGTPLLPDVRKMKPDDFVVLELSSFQLMGTKMKPDVTVVTNITPNHLDWHTSYDEYIEAKTAAFKSSEKSHVLVVNGDNEVTAQFVGNGETRVFTHCDVPEVLLESKIKIPGQHNLENYMAAYFAVKDYVSCDTVKFVAETFGGVPHRIELVRELDGVKYYNSSIDSSPNRTIKALSVFPEKKVVMLAGGKDKGIPYDEIGPAVNKTVKVLVLTGPTSKVIADAVNKADGEKPEMIFIDDFETAVKTCREKATSGDIVLLSPASTSFDRFKNFEERGDTFRQIVLNF